MPGPGGDGLPSATPRCYGTTCSRARASSAQPRAPTVLARTNPDGHPGTGASAGELHFGPARGTSRPNSEPVRSLGAISQKGNPRSPRPKPTSAQPPPSGTRTRAGVRREAKSSFGSPKVVRVRLNTPCQESSGGMVRLLKWARRSTGPSRRLRRAGAPSPSADAACSLARSLARGPAPPAGSWLVLSCQVLTMYKHTAGTHSTRPLRTPAPI